MLNQSLSILIVIVALFDTFGCINFKPSVKGQTSYCLENSVDGLVCAQFNDRLVRQQFYVSRDLPSWQSTGKGAFISGPVSTA